jgi:hypothetical protein
MDEGEPIDKKPIRGIFARCCAVATAPPNVRAIAKRPNHFRFWILDFGLTERKSGVLLIPCLSLIQNRQSKIQNHFMTLSARASTLGEIA